MINRSIEHNSKIKSYAKELLKLPSMKKKFASYAKCNDVFELGYLARTFKKPEHFTLWAFKDIKLKDSFHLYE